MKTEIKAELILASKNAATDDILYTFRLTYPRFILAELLTHRKLSRNTASSRAIPMKKMRHQVLVDPFLPLFIGAAQKGMQAGKELGGLKRWVIEKLWAWGRYPAIGLHWLLETAGAPKQLTNRVIEPWLWTVQIVSATDLKNFIKLRTHHMAEPHLNLLAHQVANIIGHIKDCLDFAGAQGDYTRCALCGKCQILEPGEWHLPFVTEDEHKTLSIEDQRFVSAARCARVSYTVIESKNYGTTADIILGKNLISAHPTHGSPLEHPAVANGTSLRFANFRGWAQYRYFIPNEAGGDE